MTDVAIPERQQLPDTGFALTRITADSAEQLTDLIAQARTDDAVVKEFPATLEAYSKPCDENRQRLQDMYDTRPAQRVGYLVVEELTNRPVGMTYIGTRARGRVYSHDGRVTPFTGINFSTWLLEEVRGRGVRTVQGEFLSNIARELQGSNHPDDSNWSEGTLYTGIRDGNIASERATASRGYEPVGVLLHDTAYRAWFRPNEWHSLQARVDNTT